MLARQWMPQLPFDRVDVLLIDRIGKEISGTGLDTNVVGRKFDDHKAVEGECPKVRAIAVRGLTPETHGNAIGLGIAEFCKYASAAGGRLGRHAAQRDDGQPRLGRDAPLGLRDRPRDPRRGPAASASTEPRKARLLWIRDTLALAELECSAAYLDEARQRPNLEILTPLRDLPLDADGNLPATCGGLISTPCSEAPASERAISGGDCCVVAGAVQG